MVTTLVLDTHVWVKASNGESGYEEFDTPGYRCVLPAISVWEAGMLVAKGRLTLHPDIATWVRRNLEPPVFLQPLTPAIALRAAGLQDFHGDPADRMIVATALELDLKLATADDRIVRWYQRQPSLAERILRM
jgi:PIN domain nuclease of toxin-antitoxin system